MFKEYEPNATFHYLRSFRRVRVDFEAHLAASSAKLSLDGTPMGNNVIHCYFLQVRPGYLINILACCGKPLLRHIFNDMSSLHVFVNAFQILSPCTDEDAYLHVPPLEKQFLISPPASPPVGWEQPKEDKPVVDYDLLSAMASLSPGTCILTLFQ